LTNPTRSLVKRHDPCDETADAPNHDRRLLADTCICSIFGVFLSNSQCSILNLIIQLSFFLFDFYTSLMADEEEGGVLTNPTRSLVKRHDPCDETADAPNHDRRLLADTCICSIFGVFLSNSQCSIVSLRGGVR
ncbi:hypothetical protein Tco_1415725, partial [Tanacetum coccineum]